MATRAELVRAIVAGQAQAERVRSSTLTLIDRLWRSLPSYRDRDIDQFVARVLPIVNGGMRATANMTVANINTVIRLVEGQAAPVAVPQVDTATVRGVPAETVYRRPATTVYAALADGRTFRQAVEVGRQRLADIAATDLQLAKTHTAQTVFAVNGNVVGYRRVLEGSKNCGLCVVASTQRYHKAELMPIHPGCDCGVAPIVGETDPGQVVDPDRLADLHQTMVETFGDSRLSGRGDGDLPDYRDVVVVHEHGEIGRVLGVRGQHFTGPNDL